MKNLLLTITLLLISFTSAWTQHFNADKSEAMRRLLNRGDYPVHGVAASSGFHLTSIHYLLTEYRISHLFPVTGLYYDKETRLYSFWVNNENPSEFHVPDSMVIKGVGSDGVGIWVRLDFHDGMADPLPDDWEPTPRKCTSIFVYVRSAEGMNLPKIFENAKLLTCPCGQDSLEQLPPMKGVPIGSWPNANDGLAFLKERFQNERRDLELSNFHLYTKDLGAYNLPGEPWMLQLMYCGEHNIYHHFSGGMFHGMGYPHDGYILRYFFDRKKWTVMHVDDPKLGWQVHQGYLNRNGRVIPVDSIR